MPSYFRVCWIFALILLASCSRESTKQRPDAPQWQGQAAGRTDRDDISDRLVRHLLQAETLIQSGDQTGAQRELDIINQAELSIEQRSKFYFLAAQIDLAGGDAQHALKKLKLIRPVFLSKADKVEYYQAVAAANLLLGNVLQAVNSRISLGYLLEHKDDQQRNMAEIINLLSLLPENVLDYDSGIGTELRGWMALAKIFSQRDHVGFDITGQIQKWHLDYPGHPANPEFLQSYLQSPANANDEGMPTQTNGESIAVLLPISGPYAPAGKAIKEGMLAAYRLAAGMTPQPALKFYDSAEDEINQLYQRAVAEGAKQVVGPLVKEQIQSMARNTSLNVPVLALNHVEDLSQYNLFQFGLSPIDEVSAVAHKAISDGRQSALILVPNSTLGQRIANYMTDTWLRLGGTVAGVQSYDPRQHDAGASLDRLIANSVFPSEQQTPRALLLSANDEIARELSPYLKYHQNANLAVYAMPTIYSGRPNPVLDVDLGLFSFCDVPWLFADFYGGPLSQSALRSSWEGLPDSLVRLVALGIDAYNLAGHLAQLSTSPYSGATGQLSLGSENRIVRKLVCAQYKGGIPVASGFAD
ncbi:MAG: penicillin-binding protein activator [Gammaproteobacteria bacterium]